MGFSSKDNEAGTGTNVQTAPLVLLLAPVNGSTYAEGTQVGLHAIAQDSLTGVSRIEFRVNDIAIGDVPADDPGGQPSLEAQFAWTATGKQGHLITVEAFRADGSSLGLNEVAVTVTGKPSAQTGTPPPGTQEAGPGVGTVVPTPDSAANPTAQPGDMGILSGPFARVNTPSLIVRQGPGTTYLPVGDLAQGEQVLIVGRNADTSWWAVSYADGTGWVFASLVIVEGDASQVPLAAAP
jgi:hypothetical protein